MRAKLTLTKVWCENKHGIIMDHGGNESNGTRNMKNVNYVPKEVQKILSSHKMSKKVY